MDKKIVLLLLVCMMVENACGYNNSVVDPKDTITPDNFIGKWVNTVNDTKNQETTSFASNLGSYIIFFLYSCIAALILFSLKHIFWGSK
jgi:hypothetical protein